MKPEKHRHKTSIDRRQGKRLHVRCSGCSKTWWRTGVPCPPCEEGVLERQAARTAFAQEYLKVKAASGVAAAEALTPPKAWSFEPGCADCFQGLTLLKPTYCCCRTPDIPRCEGCRNVALVPGGHLQPHVCLRATPEEIDHELFLEDLEVKRYATTDATEQKATTLDHSQGIRVRKYD